MNKDGFWVRWIITAGLALLAGWIIIHAIGGWISERIAGEPFSYLEHYYDFFNYTADKKGQYPPCQDIVIIDAYDSSIGSRSGMAEVLTRLSGMNPAVVGMDILFPNTHESTLEEDSELAAASALLKDKLIMGCRRHGRDSLEHSFFTQSSSLPYATVNAQSFFGFTPSDSVSGKRVNKLVYAMAQRYKPDLSTENLIINYESLSFRELSQPDQIVPSVIDGKIVLIGDCYDSKDEVDLPFLIEGKSSLSGVKVNAYQLASLIHPEHALKPISAGYSLLTSILLVLVFTFFSCRWSPKENRLVDAKGFKNAREVTEGVFIILLRPLAVILAEICAILVLLFSIHWAHIIPDILLFMASIPFVGTFDKAATLVYKYRHPSK